MKLNNLFPWIIRNWPVKVMSLVIAMFLFYLALTLGMGERQMLSEAELIIPQELELAAQVDPEVRITLRGPHEQIYMVHPDQLHITADFSHARKPGTYTAYVKLRNIHTLMHITPLEVTFYPIRITIELTESKGGSP